MYYAIRSLMRDAAHQADLNLDRMSFLNSLRIVRRQVTEPAAFPPEDLGQRVCRVIGEIIRRANPTRRLRAYPRVVKRKMSNFPVKREKHRDWPNPHRPADQAVVITGASKTHPATRSRDDTS